MSCVGVGRWPAGRCVVLFTCVLAYLHRNAGEFSFKKNRSVSLHFFPTLFLFFLLCYLRNSFHFSLTFLLLCVSLWRFCPCDYVFFCCSVVSLVLTFSIGINVIFHQLFLLFVTVPPPILPIFVLLKCTYLQVCLCRFVVFVLVCHLFLFPFTYFAFFYLVF